MPPSDNRAPAELDPVVEAYKKDVDRTLLRENLKLTPWERLLKHQSMLEFVTKWRGRARVGSSAREAASR